MYTLILMTACLAALTQGLTDTSDELEYVKLDNPKEEEALSMNDIRNWRNALSRGDSTDILSALEANDLGQDLPDETEECQDRLFALKRFMVKTMRTLKSLSKILRRESKAIGQVFVGGDLPSQRKDELANSQFELKH